MTIMATKINNHMDHTSNGEHKSINIEDRTNKRTEEALKDQDVEVNMHGRENSNGIQRVKEEKCDDVDLTESSSSFDSDGTSFTDVEDDPELYDDALSALSLDKYRKPNQMRKKKLLSSWKKCVEPLRWRCKWVELQIKKFESQARKYDRKIAELENVNPKREFLKRKKRRRVEETEAISSYMSRHNLFSYFENKKYNADAAATDGNSGNQGDATVKSSNRTNEAWLNEETISREILDQGDPLEEIFWKIGVMKWQVTEMSSRVHKVLSENLLRISSNENSASLENKNGVVTVASSIKGEIVCNDSDIKSIDSQTIGGSTRNPAGTILMYNRRAKMNPNIPKEVSIVSSTDDRQGSSLDVLSHHVLEPSPSSPNTRNSLSKTMLENTSWTRSFKRKRAVRKAGSGKWVEIQNE